MFDKMTDIEVRPGVHISLPFSEEEVEVLRFFYTKRVLVAKK